jgi:hypothetical protein
VQIKKLLYKVANICYIPLITKQKEALTMTTEYHNSNDLYEEFKKYGFTTERTEELKKELKDQFDSTSGVLGKCFGDVL